MQNQGVSDETLDERRMNAGKYCIDQRGSSSRNVSWDTLLYIAQCTIRIEIIKPILVSLLTIWIRKESSFCHKLKFSNPYIFAE